MHGHSASISGLPEDDFDGEFRTPSRRGTYSKFEADAIANSAIPGPSGIPMLSGRRQSGGPGVTGAGAGRRTSSGIGKS